MSSFFTRKLRLKPTILTLFIVLTMPVTVAIVAVTYVSNDRIAHDNAGRLVERFQLSALEDIQNVFEPIKTMVHSAAVLGEQEPDFYFDDRSLPYLQSVLLHNDKIVSVYVGLDDGTFRQARRIDPKIEIQDKLPPEGARFAYRWIVRGSDGRMIDRYEFHDSEGRVLGTSEAVTTYDPRPRGWYRNTARGQSTNITDPDVFSALGLIGFTVAAPVRASDKLLGIAAVDITLDGLSEYLSDRRISRNTLSYILDHQGHVIANSEMARTYVSENGQLELQHITSLDSKLTVAAFGARPDGPENLYDFSYDGYEYVGSLSLLPPSFHNWQLFTITPLSDFTSAFQRNNDWLLALGVVATALQIAIIYLLSGIVSAPLEKLARKVDHIREFEDDGQPRLQSPVHEIMTLSNAIETLNAAITAFASFVPVGLVRELIHSDQKLQLGGHSRFLTILFSDLEAFSSLSEEVPSQELLLRVSAYLGLATQAVNAEHGTIDKFMGDGVMAFWGAPALLEDHAWRACVTAVRILRGMAALNEQWQAQGLKPLNLRIGIHSDAVLVGNIGSRERLSYTVLGDGVNVAARLEGVNKEFGTRICISQSVYKEAGERLCVRPIDDVTVKGRRTRIPIFELLGVHGAGADLEPAPTAVRLAELTRLAYEALIRGELSQARERYQKVLCEFPDDAVAQALLKRLGPV